MWWMPGVAENHPASSFQVIGCEPPVPGGRPRRSMEWAWLIPVLSFAVVPLIILFGKYLPGKGSPLAILAILGGFALFWLTLFSFLGASPATDACHTSEDTGALTCSYERTWFEAGFPGTDNDVDRRVRLTWGIIVDPLTIAMLGLATL